MKNTKYIVPMFTFYDRTGIQSYLENQAEKGWILDSIGNFRWKFRRIEPKRLHFSVNYFPKASAFDAEPSEQQQQFQEFCAHTGWILAASNAQMNIFYNEAEHPVPVDTDAELEVENIHKSMKKTIMPSYYIMVVCGLLQMALFFWRFSEQPLSVLANKFNLFTGFCWFMILVITGVEIGSYFLWHKKAKEAAKTDGSFMKTKGHRGFQCATIIIMLVAVAFLMLSLNDDVAMGIVAILTVFVIIGITVIVLGLSKLMKKWKFSAKTNFVVTCVATLGLSVGLTFWLIVTVISNIDWNNEENAVTYTYRGMTFYEYHDELPLTIEDIKDVDYKQYSYELWEEESVLLGMYEATQSARMGVSDEPGLSYVILDVRVPFLYDWCLKEMLDEFTYSYEGAESVIIDAVVVDAQPWGANKVYQLYEVDALNNDYLLCYDDCIVEFSATWELTEEEMRAVGEKFA